MNIENSLVSLIYDYELLLVYSKNITLGESRIFSIVSFGFGTVKAGFWRCQDLLF